MNELDSTSNLHDFLRTAATLSVPDRKLIAEQALILLEQNYAHLPLKAARYALNPVQRLRLLIARLSRGEPAEAEWRFHAEMLAIFGSLHDLHTRYVLPEPFASAVAFLPFRIKEFTRDGTRHIVVAPLRDGNRAPTSTVPYGVELVTWNGVPIERAVEVFGDRLPGANPAARHARAMEQFTVRSLGFAGPPDEEFVVIQYLDPDGVAQETREAWRVVLPTVENQGLVLRQASEGEPDRELDVEAARAAWLKTLLFAPDIVELMSSRAARVAPPGWIEVSRPMANCFNARVVPDVVPELGHIRIRSFSPPMAGGHPDTVAFVNEFIRLLGLIPPTGLVVDIRGNGGGSPVAAELCLQALTARRIQSQPLQFITSPLNLRICRNSPAPDSEDLRAWLPSMEQAVESGAVYSSGVPRTPDALLAEVPQAYIGPVVLVIDGRVYSAADRFAAGFQDNAVGLVLGVDANTGAGGANVWEYADLVRAMVGVTDSPYRELPAGANLTVAIRRTLRVGPNQGAPVEDFGVVPDKLHQITHDDIYRQDVDLMAHAAELIGQPPLQPERRFDVRLEESPNGLRASFEVKNVDRADVYLDGRPHASIDLADGTASATMPAAESPREVRVVGVANGDPVAVRVFRRDQEGLLVHLSTFG